jgi:hypothetical protein
MIGKASLITNTRTLQSTSGNISNGNVNWFMNYHNVAPEAWLLCTEWVADVMNHTAEESLGDVPPLQVLLGHTIDISILLIFLFWDVVYVS